jgi:mutator protein MutT
VSALLEVAVGVVIRADGQVLLGQRVAGKPYAGWWEFPGGKLEAGESVAQALARELHEELGLQVTASHPWVVREFVYPHAHVRLHFRRIFAQLGDFSGEPQSREGQAFSWQAVDAPAAAPLLPASEPVFRWLRLPTRLAVWDPAEDGDFAAALARSQSLGVRLLVSSQQPRSFAHAAGGLLLEPSDLRALEQRPDIACCVARCRSAEDLSLAAALELDAVVAQQVIEMGSLPFYLADTALALDSAIALGAQGLAIPG